MNCSCLQSPNGDVHDIMVQNIKSVYDEKGLNVSRQHLENDIVEYAEANEFEWNIHHVKVLNSSELGETRAGFIRLCNVEKHTEVIRELNGRLWNGLRLNLFINPKPTQTHHLYKKKLPSHLNTVEIDRLKEHISELERELARVKLENENLRAGWSNSNQSLSVDELLDMRVESLEAAVLSPTINSDLKELAESTTDKYEELRKMEPLVDVDPSKIELKEPPKPSAIKVIKELESTLTEYYYKLPTEPAHKETCTQETKVTGELVFEPAFSKSSSFQSLNGSEFEFV